MFKKTREKLNNFYDRGEGYKREVKREIRIWIIVTLAFTIAFSWRQTIFDVFQAGLHKFFGANGPTILSVLTSTTITLVSIILILLASYFLQEKKSSNY
jgi:hypothetical protein